MNTKRLFKLTNIETKTRDVNGAIVTHVLENLKALMASTLEFNVRRLNSLAVANSNIGAKSISFRKFTPQAKGEIIFSSPTMMEQNLQTGVECDNSLVGDEEMGKGNDAKADGQNIDHGYVHHATDVAGPKNAFIRLLNHVGRWVVHYAEIRKSRIALSKLNEYELGDIGISKAQADFETSRPFWDVSKK